MKKNIEKCLDFTHQLCWIVPFFIVLFYVKNDSAKNVNFKTRGEPRLDTVYTNPCEGPAFLYGYENDTFRISRCIAPGRIISVYGKIINRVDTNFSYFRRDTIWGRDSLIYSFNKRRLKSFEYLKISHNLYDCSDSLISSKIVSVYPKYFAYPMY